MPAKAAQVGLAEGVTRHRTLPRGVASGVAPCRTTLRQSDLRKPARISAGANRARMRCAATRRRPRPARCRAQSSPHFSPSHGCGRGSVGNARQGAARGKVEDRSCPTRHEPKRWGGTQRETSPLRRRSRCRELRYPPAPSGSRESDDDAGWAPRRDQAPSGAIIFTIGQCQVLREASWERGHLAHPGRRPVNERPHRRPTIVQAGKMLALPGKAPHA